MRNPSTRPRANSSVSSRCRPKTPPPSSNWARFARERGQLDVARQPFSKAVRYSRIFLKPRWVLPAYYSSKAARAKPSRTWNRRRVWNHGIRCHIIFWRRRIKALGNAAAADRELNLYRTLGASAKHTGAADDEPSEH